MIKHFLKVSNLYWLLPLLLLAAQIIFTINSFSQIRYEELAESVRNPFWLEHRTVYDGVSSNVGWYGTLLIIYKIFGFSLYGAKIYRIVLAGISLFCLAALLKKFLGAKYAWLPLLTIGLSPTLLFFNTLQTSFGTDLQYFPIALFLLFAIDFEKRWIPVVCQILLGLVVMVAWMSYPTFVFYLPALGFLYLRLLLKAASPFNFLLVLASFLLPLLVVFSYIKDPGLLWYDQNIGSGIFRGAGTLYLNWDNFTLNFGRTLGDLFSFAQSYYLEVQAVEFSYFLPLLGVILVLILSLLLLLSVKKIRFFLALTWMSLLLTLVFANLAFDPSGYPGLRRSTPILAAFYTLSVFVWYSTVKLKYFAGLRALIVIAMLILASHHLLTFPVNLTNLTQPSPFRYSLFFGEASTPAEALGQFVDRAKREELELSCRNGENQTAACRYGEIYAAVAGSCLWNHLPCHEISGYDEKSGGQLPLRTGIWETYYWAH